MKTAKENDGTTGPVVAIDGPVASGKTSVGRAVAERMGFRFLDTGIMYRAVTWLALKLRVNIDDYDAVGRLAEGCKMSLVGDDPAHLIVVDGHPLTAEDLASTQVDRNVSAVAASSPVRHALVEQQRAIASAGGIIMVGRDIGSVVLADADVKLYVDASPEERARRRFRQQKENGTDADYEQALADTIKRDLLDSQRADSPLTVPDDAVVIDTEQMDFEQSVATVMSQISTATSDITRPEVTRR